MEEIPKKQHHNVRAGPKAEKKKKTNLKKKGKENEKRRNPKAFAPKSHVNAERRLRRKLDQETKRHHVPLVDRATTEPAPFLVAVVGPPGVGKSTLVTSLIYHYTKHNLVEVKGPITVISGKKRRLTFFECPNDLNSMIDIAKVADLVLLMVDAHFGFEMETFEFLNICQTHGFPRIMGVLSHLDQFTTMKAMRKAKKQLKHRFWTEIYQGAKLFYLSGLINGRYTKTDVFNLARFISVMKFRPLIWRNSHSYLLVDRLEDLTDPQLKKQERSCSRRVAMYGYVRGSNLKENSKIHIPGCRDFEIQSITALPDPCPLPNKERIKRTLKEKDRLLYAPMSDVGNLFYDADAVYINLPENRLNFTHIQGVEATDGEGENMVRELQKVEVGIDEKLEESGLRIFKDAALFKPSSHTQVLPLAQTLPPIQTIQLETDTHPTHNDEMLYKMLDWESGLNIRSSETLESLVYKFEEEEEELEVESDDDEEFFQIKKKKGGSRTQGLELEDKDCDSCKLHVAHPFLPDDLPLFISQFTQTLSDRFASEDLDISDDDSSDDQQTASSKPIKSILNSENDGATEMDYYSQVKEQLQLQKELNSQEFAEYDEDEKHQLRGFVGGEYVRILFEDVPCEFVELHNPKVPVICGGLLPNEENLGFIQARLKKHRWFGKILKTKDPLIMSIGW
eukprot:CAMPEP_0174275150 /NCGR_PEP_ID=MMETSP0439-20130205/59671_1 /TAXON_ID=0 /ORGANISM="Stereomyxa ramosa, Strain Chinc5" /LENGTH=678 /DNA_ID=CAMNT_0015367231 /DNA_START=30 /DNA_END=2063 /DNA_ORIENTATION=+